MEQEYSLYPQRDPQQQREFDRCPRCGRERYGADGDCIYCARFFR